MDMKLTVSDSLFRVKYIEYIKDSLLSVVRGLGGSAQTAERDERAELDITLPEDCVPYFRASIEEKIGEVIAVGYKNEYFEKYVRVSGLNNEEYSLLLSALIAADFQEDRAYAASKIVGDPYTIDGSFNFTLKPLSEKWAEVVSCLPPVFRAGQLKDFISYLVSERKGRKVYVAKGGVYDECFTRLRRVNLCGDDENLKIVREVILSGEGEVELDFKPPEKDEFYLKEYFGEKIFFGKGYFD